MTRLRTIACWISEEGMPNYARSFSFAPEVTLANARTGPVDVGRADALLLSGGEDISAEFLHQPVSVPAPIEDTNPARDCWEFGALRRAVDRDIPIFGICRGLQLLNVGLGGTLLLDIPGHRQPREGGEMIQPVTYRDSVPSWRRFPKVNSEHHQAVDRLGEGLEAEGWSPADRIVEQVSHRQLRWCLGVQYHPERHAAYRSLFAAFVAAIPASPPSP